MHTCNWCQGEGHVPYPDRHYSVACPACHGLGVHDTTVREDYTLYLHKKVKDDHSIPRRGA